MVPFPLFSEKDSNKGARYAHPEKTEGFANHQGVQWSGGHYYSISRKLSNKISPAPSRVGPKVSNWALPPGVVPSLKTRKAKNY